MDRRLIGEPKLTLVIVSNRLMTSSGWIRLRPTVATLALVTLERDSSGSEHGWVE